MDGLSWQPIAPTRKHTTAASLSFSSPPPPWQAQPQQQPLQPVRTSLSGPAASQLQRPGTGPSAARYNNTTVHIQPKLTALPTQVLIHILSYVPLPDLPQAARAHSNIAAAFSSEELWSQREKALGWKPVSFWDRRLAELVNAFPSSNGQPTQPAAVAVAPAPAASNQEEDDDGFGDFEEASAPTSTTPAAKSFFDVADFTPQKVATATGGTQVLFNAASYRRVPSPERHEAYRKVRAYTTLLRPLATFLLEAIPADFVARRANTGTRPQEISLLGEDSPRPLANIDGSEYEEDDALPSELSSTLLWSHPSIPTGSSLTWQDQVALLTNLIRFVSPTRHHEFQGLRTPPPVVAWKYEDGIWPWPSSPAEAAELLSRLALQGRGDGRSKRASFAGLWRASDSMRHEARGYEAPSRRGSPPPGTITEESSPNPENGRNTAANGEIACKTHLMRCHQLHVLAQVLLTHATALEHTVLLPTFEGAAARKKDAERAAGLLGPMPASLSAKTSTFSQAMPVLGEGGTADAVKRAEESMANAARAAWALRRAFLVSNTLLESPDLSTPDQSSALGMLCRPPRLPATNVAQVPSTTPSTATVAPATSATIDPLDLPPPTLSRPTAAEIAALGHSLFQAWLSTLPILQRSSTLRQSHDPRSNLVSFSLPPMPSQGTAAYSTGADLDFGPMADAFIPAVIDALKDALESLRRLFPVDEGQIVDVQLLQRVVEVILMGDYINGLMSHVAALEKGSKNEPGLAKWVEDVQGKPPLSLRALPAAFAQAMRLPAVLIPQSTAAPSTPKEKIPSATTEETASSLTPEQQKARLRAEDVIYLAFEPRMDAYLAHERDWVQRGMDRICTQWNQSGDANVGANAGMSGATKTDEAFLASANPVAAKKSLLTSFKDVLLVPVSVVPRTATFVGGAVVNTFAPRRRDAIEDGLSAGASNGALGKLNPAAEIGTSVADDSHGSGYIEFSKGGDGPFGVGDDEDDEEEENDGGQLGSRGPSYALGKGVASSPFGNTEADAWASADHGIGSSGHHAASSISGSTLSGVTAADEGWGDFSSSSRESTRPTSMATSGARSSIMSTPQQQLAPPSTTTPTPGSGRSTPLGDLNRRTAGSGRATPVPGSKTAPGDTQDGRAALSRLQLLLSLDVALELIHLNRDTVKRIETFRGFPGAYGTRVRQEIEGIAVAFLQTLSGKHLTPGLKEATDQVKAWIPAEHDASSASSKKKKKERKEAIAHARMGKSGSEASDEAVEPLVHFFELVHVGDAIQQMVQFYFDQELSKHVDRTDFLNVVVREKKRFEGNLDECVAQGLNAGVDGLMGQVDYLMSTRQGPRDYYPEKPEHMDLGNPTEACQDVVRCLKTHCSMLVGSTDKSVLEVFYQEVGLRLYALICKHLKRQIISIDGGFKVIADLNAYHAFVASFLRQPQVLTYFDALKMLGNIYIIDHPRELAQIVRDANMFGGMLSPEELYEFLQARADFKAIEKAVDKEMYGFKVAEDCVIC